MSIRILDAQPTPNPNAVKLVLDRPVSEQPMSFFNAAAAGDHSLAKSLFEVPGVASLLLLGDFITVNKTPDAKWPAVKKGVEKVLSSIE